MTTGGAAAVAAALVAVTVAGVAQARRMTLLRRNALGDPSDTRPAARVRRGARDAAVLRAHEPAGPVPPVSP